MLKYLLGFFLNLFNPAVSFFAKIDNKSRISHKAKVYGHVQVTSSSMGDYSYIGRNSRIIHADIGKFCSIASETKIGMGTHTLDKISTSPIFTEAKNGTKHSWVKTSAVNPFKRVKVGNDVWIGVRTMVMGGVTIGDGAVIGAGSIVTKDILIRYRFSQEQIDDLLAHPWWCLPERLIREKIELFQSSDNIAEVIKELRHA